MDEHLRQRRGQGRWIFEPFDNLAADIDGPTVQLCHDDAPLAGPPREEAGFAIRHSDC
jgi:hypothetical protein